LHFAAQIAYNLGGIAIKSKPLGYLMNRMSNNQRLPLIAEIPNPPAAPQAFEAFKDNPFSFFLDSGMDPQRLGRYSLMGSDPFLIMKSRSWEITLIRPEGTEIVSGNPFDILGELLCEYKIESNDSKLPFLCGAVGYLSYDLGHFIERLPSRAIDDLLLPECYFGFYDAIVAFDNLEKIAYVVSTGFPEVGGKRLRCALKR
jgi:para-aminobenzoate synthetase component 1